MAISTLEEFLDQVDYWDNLGGAMQEQLRAIVTGASMEDQNPNALEIIAREFLRQVDLDGAPELADDIDAYLMDASEGRYSGSYKAGNDGNVKSSVKREGSTMTREEILAEIRAAQARRAGQQASRRVRSLRGTRSTLPSDIEQMLLEWLADEPGPMSPGDVRAMAEDLWATALDVAGDPLETDLNALRSYFSGPDDLFTALEDLLIETNPDTGEAPGSPYWYERGRTTRRTRYSGADRPVSRFGRAERAERER